MITSPTPLKGDNLTRQLMDCFAEDRAPPVWSVLITVFGDLAQGTGAQISSPVLGQITQRMGIKPEAMRVALHRLRKDGWITSKRAGRSGVHALSDLGRSQSAAASPLIYAQSGPRGPVWLVLSDPKVPSSDDDDDGVALLPHMRLTMRQSSHGSTLATALTPDADLPDWLTTRICPPALVTASQKYAAGLARFEGILSASPDGDCLDRAALRVIIVHGWRRIILKAPRLPEYTFPPDWAGSECRQRVTALLDRLGEPDLTALHRAASEA